MNEEFDLFSPNLLEAVKGFEGYQATPKWDYKQWSSGWGTQAVPNETPDTSEHERRLKNELAKAAQFVDRQAPGLPPGVRDAMISLTFNAGGDWANSGLGTKLRSGDYEGAKQSFAQYTKAGGEELGGLVKRRNQELTWFDKGGADPSGDAPVVAGFGPPNNTGNNRMPGIFDTLAPDQSRPAGLLGSITDPESLSYMAMIARAFNPYSQLDPGAMLAQAQKLKQAQAENQAQNFYRQQQLMLDQSRERREQEAANRPQYITRPDGSIIAVPRQGGNFSEVAPAIREMDKDLAQLNRVNTERSAAGQPPISEEDWVLQKRTAGAMRIGETTEEKLAAERGDKIMQAASSATPEITRLNQLEERLNQFESGKLAPATMTIGAWAKGLGVNDEILKSAGLDPKKIGNMQAFQTITNRMLVDQIGQGKFPANNFSDADRQFLSGTLTQITNLPGANKDIIEVFRRAAKQDLEKGKEYLKWRRAPENKGKNSNDFEMLWADKVESQNLFDDIRKKYEGNTSAPSPGAPSSGYKVLKVH